MQSRVQSDERLDGFVQGDGTNGCALDFSLQAAISAASKKKGPVSDRAVEVAAALGWGFFSKPVSSQNVDAIITNGRHHRQDLKHQGRP